MEKIDLTKNLTLDSIDVKNIVENIKQLEFYQNKSTILTKCVLSQCADILTKQERKRR